MKFLGEEDFRVGKGGQYPEECGVGIVGFACAYIPKLCVHQCRSSHYQVIRFSLDTI